MTHKKKETNFNHYWQHLDHYARNVRRMKKGEWMSLSGISYQRYSEFAKGRKALSANYFIKLCGGLNLNHDDVEKMSCKTFSQEQKELLRFEAFVKANKDWLEILMKDPEKITGVKKMLGLE